MSIRPRGFTELALKGRRECESNLVIAGKPGKVGISNRPLPHCRHLMTQTPRLELLERRIQRGGDALEFLLVIYETIGEPIRNGIVILANISQHAQQSLTFLGNYLPKRTIEICLKQSNYDPAVLLDR